MVVQKTTMQLFAFSKRRRSAALLSGYPEPDKQADPHGKGHGARLLERPLSPLLKSVKERECNSKKQNRQGSLPRGISLCDADDGQYLGNSSYPLQRIASRFRLYLFVPRIFTGSFVMVFHIAAPNSRRFFGQSNPPPGDGKTGPPSGGPVCFLKTSYFRLKKAFLPGY